MGQRFTYIWENEVGDIRIQVLANTYDEACNILTAFGIDHNKMKYLGWE